MLRMLNLLEAQPMSFALPVASVEVIACMPHTCMLWRAPATTLLPVGYQFHEVDNCMNVGITCGQWQKPLLYCSACLMCSIPQASPFTRDVQSTTRIT
jgi:hypothetical protein